MVLACQSAGLAFALHRYGEDRECDAAKQREEVARRSLDRVCAYATARNPEKLVLELELYREQLEAAERRRVWWTGSRQRCWSDVWMTQRVALDPRATEMEAHRVSLKALWYMAQQAWDAHPESASLFTEFFVDAPLNATLAQRCLQLVEPMDGARARRYGRTMDQSSRPKIYRFLEEMYGLDVTDLSRRDRAEQILAFNNKVEKAGAR